MPVFEIEAGGKTFEVDAPDQQSALTAVGSRPERGVLDKLTGRDGGERFQTWPERLVRDILNAPQRAMEESERLRTEGNFNPGPVMDAAALASPLSVARRAGELALPGAKTAFTEGMVKREIPSAEKLKATGGNQIEQARNMGVEFKPEAVQNLGGQIENALQGAGANDLVAPETFGILKKLRDIPAGAVASTFGNLQNLREQLGSAAASTDARERRAASLAIRELDKFLGGDVPQAALAGTTTPEALATAGDIYKTGRGNYAAAKRSDEVTGREEAADLRAAATNSGRNIDNLTRQRFVDILTNDAKGRGYSPEAIKQVEELVRGSRGANAARYTGNLLGGGGGLAQALMMGGAGIAGAAATGSPYGAAAGAAPMAVGATARAIANALTKRAARKVDEQVRKESPLYRGDPGNPTYPGVNDAIVRSLLQMQLNPQ